MRAFEIVAASTLALFSTASPLAAQPARVHVIGTGGTIAGGAGGPLSASEIVELLPDVARIARVSAEDFSNIGSSRMTPALQLRLARRVLELFETEPELSGIVITHGTDSLEESAFLLDLIVPAGRPVVFAAAMRPPREPGSDGPHNLENAIRIAASPGMRGLGVLVTLDDEIHAARDARKTDAFALDAFASPGAGPIGRVDSGRVYLFHRPARRLELSVEAVEPRVDLVSLYTGSDGRHVRSAVASGAKGIVVEVFGRGNAPPPVMDAVREARARGIAVVFATRTGSGRVELGEEALRLGVISAEDLDGLKARLVLVASLASTQDAATLQSYFRILSGEVVAPVETN